METTIACPACRKKHPLPPQSPACTRCGLDFTSLMEVRDAAARARRHALDHLRAGAYEDALASATESWNLQHHAASARIAYLTCLVQGDFDSAAEWRNSHRGT